MSEKVIVPLYINILQEDEDNNESEVRIRTDTYLDKKLQEIRKFGYYDLKASSLRLELSKFLNNEKPETPFGEVLYGFFDDIIRE